MLTFEAPFYHIKDVIVFRDHAVKTQFYYLAGLPKLSVDATKKPQFTLLKYHDALDAGGPAIKNRDALGGAFLMLGVDCAVDPDSLKGDLSSQAGVDGDISLTPVLYTSGTAQIVVLDYQPLPTPPPGPATPPAVSHFVKAVIGSTTPSLLGDQRAIFSISLDADAATLIEQAYENDMSPIGVIYQLQFSGLRPALQVSAEVDYKRVYDQLKIDFQFGLHTGSSGTSTTSTTNPATNPATGSSNAAANANLNSTATQQPLQQPIQIRVQKEGALGAASIKFLPGAAAPTDTTGTEVPLAKPAAGQTSFRWTVPGVSNLQIDFPATDNYVAGDQFTVTVNRQIERIFANKDSNNKPASPLITVVQPTAAPVIPPPPTVNKPTGTSGTQGTSGTSAPASSGGTQVAIDVNIDYTMQKLVESGAIKITIVRQQEGKSEDDMQKEAMDLIKEDILKDFFKPQMTTTPLPATPPAVSPANAGASNINSGAAGAQGTKVSIGFQLQEIHQDELRTMTFDYNVQSPTTQIHAPNGFFSALISKTNRNDLIKDISLDDDFFKTVNVTASSIADYGATDLRAVVLDLAYGGTADEPSSILSPTFNATDNSPKTFQSFIDNGEMSYRYRSSYYFGQNPLVAAQTSEYHTDWRTTLTRALVVNPPIDVPMLHVYVAPGLIDWDLIAQIETTLSYDDPDNAFHAEHTFKIAPTFERDDWIIRLTNPEISTYNVKHTWILKDNGRRINGPVEQMSAAQLFVFDPFVDRLPVIVQPEVDPTSVPRVAIVFHYQDPANQFNVLKVVLLAPPYQPTVVSLPLMNAKKRSYSYQTTLYKTVGLPETRAEVTTDQSSIIIADGALPIDVSVILVGDLTQAGLTALQVDLRSEPLDGQSASVQSHLFQIGGDTKWVQRLSLRIDRPDHTYQVQTTAFYANKDPLQSDWNDHDTSILVIQPSRLEP